MPARRTRCGSGRSRFRSTTRRSTRPWAATPRSPSTAGATGSPTSGKSSLPRLSPAGKCLCGTRWLQSSSGIRSAGAGRPADGVVVARSVKAQKDGTARFLQGFYSGLAGAGVPAVGVEVSGAVNSAIPAFERSSLVDRRLDREHTGAARARAASCRWPVRELRRGGHRNGRRPPARAGPDDDDRWLSSRSSSPRATRRSGSARQCGRWRARFREPRSSSPTTGRGTARRALPRKRGRASSGCRGGARARR